MKHQKTLTGHVAELDAYLAKLGHGGFLGVDEIRAAFGCHRATVLRAIRRGDLRGIRLSRQGRWLFTRRDVAKWVTRNGQARNPDA